MSKSDDKTWPARWEAARGKWEMAPGPPRRGTRDLWDLLGEEAMRARKMRAALATTVQRIGARLDEVLAEGAADADRVKPAQVERGTTELDDDEELTVTDEDGDSLTLTRAEWRRAMSSDEGDDGRKAGLFWFYDGVTRCVQRIGESSVWVHDDADAIRQWVDTGVYPGALDRDEEPVREAESEPRQYERRMGQPTQAPEQLVAVRPDLRGEDGGPAADELRMELALLRQEHQAVRRALRAAKDDDAVELAKWYVSDGSGATLAEVREVLGCEDGEDVVERAQDVFAAAARLTHIREALEAGQWARAAELAGCGGGDE